MLSIIGIITILVIVALLISGRVSPIVAMVIPPVVAMFVAGYSFDDLGVFFNDGISSVISVAIMFIFAIIFFGIMQDVGLFEPIINKMVALSKGNVVLVAIVTVIVAVIAQLDGSGASTFLISITALLPLYVRLGMNPYLLLLLVGGSAAIINMIPWGGPLGRVASVLETDVTELWHPLIKIQIIGVVLMLLLAVFMGFREKRLIAKRAQTGQTLYLDLCNSILNAQTDEKLNRPKVIWENAILAIVGLAV